MPIALLEKNACYCYLDGPLVGPRFFSLDKYLLYYLCGLIMHKDQCKARVY
jgi:hypothetical protein